MSRAGVASVARHPVVRLLSVVLLASATSTTAWAEAAQPDVVDLEDGSRIEGTLVRQEPGQYVVIRKADGTEHTVMWKRIAGITARSSAGPDVVDARTDERASPVLAAGGVGFTRSSQTVERVHGRTSRHIDFAVDGAFLYGTSTGGGDLQANIYGGGASFGLKSLWGSDFPSAEGGAWSGVAVNLMGGLFGAGLVVTDGENTDGAGMTVTNLGLEVGYQFLSFGSMNPRTLEQPGWGVAVLGRLGYQWTSVYSSETTSDGDVSYGPGVALVFPTYNAGTAALKRGYFNVFLLPTGDFLFAMIGGGGAF